MFLFVIIVFIYCTEVDHSHTAKPKCSRLIQHISTHLFVNFIFALMLVQKRIQWKIGLHYNNLYPQAIAMGWPPHRGGLSEKELAMFVLWFTVSEVYLASKALYAQAFFFVFIYA